MRKIEIVKLKPWHIITMQRKRRVENANISEDMAYQLAKFPSWTGLYKGSPLGCGGVILLGGGRAEGWSCYPGFAFEFRREIFVYTKRLLDAVIKDNNLHRIQAHYRSDMPGAKAAIEKYNSHSENKKPCNWMEHLGFEFEGIARQHESDKTDALLYAKIMEI